MFSVIIPLYNKAPFVSATIESVLSQTFKEFEIIVVDDGSTDNSAEVVGRISDSRIRLFRKENEGVSIARNFGASRAIYPYLCFLDADDRWMPDFLQSMHALICRYPDQQFFSSALYLKRGGHTRSVTYGRAPDFIVYDYCRTHLMRRWNVCHVGTVCVGRKLFERAGGFPPHVRYGEDLDTWLRIACATSSMVYSNNAQFIYEIDNRGTTSSRRTKSMLDGRMEYWRWYGYQYHNKRSLRLYTTKKMLLLVVSCLRKHSWGEAWFLLRKIRIW